MNSGKRHRVHFFNVESREEISPSSLPGQMYSTWSLWTNFLRSVNKTAGAAPIPPDTMCNDDPTTPDKVSKVNFTSAESPLAEEVVLPLDWAEYLIFRERMHRRRSTGSHIIRGIKRIRIKRLRSEKKNRRPLEIEPVLFWVEFEKTPSDLFNVFKVSSFAKVNRVS